MAKPKQVGYVELEWTCPTCGTRSGGRVMVCPTCGAPQPANAQFEAPAQGPVIGLESAEGARVAQTVAAGPDVQCPFCGARNSSTAAECNQCHAPLAGAASRAQGGNLGAVPAAAIGDITCHVCGATNLGAARLCAKCGAPLQRRGAAARAGAPAPLPAPGKGGVALWWLWALGGLLIIAIAVFAWLGLRSDKYTAVAEAAHWERTVDVMGFVPVQKQAWRDEAPADATILQCRDELYDTVDEPVAGALEVCGTPYTVDTGTGYGNVMQDCEYQVFAPMCTYEVMAWVLVDTAVAEGNDLLPSWPALATAADRKQGDRNERYSCTVSVNDRRYSFPLSADAFGLCVPQSRWRVSINGLGSVVEATPADAE